MLKVKSDFTKLRVNVNVLVAQKRRISTCYVVKQDSRHRYATHYSRLRCGNPSQVCNGVPSRKLLLYSGQGVK